MIKIIELSEKDINKILELESHSAPKLPMYYGYNSEALEYQLFKNKDAKVYGAMNGEKLVGWAAYRCSEKEDGTDKGVYEMCSLVVDKDYRRKGVGLKLFNKRLQGLLKKKDLVKIYATNYPKNIPIIMLYLTNGFVPYDYKKDVYGIGGDRLYVKYERLEK